MKKYLFLTISAISAYLITSAQAYLPFEQFRKYVKAQTPNRYDSSQKLLTNRLGAELHYLYPYYQAIGWEEKFKKSLGEKNYYSNFSQQLSFAGDYSMATEYLIKSFDTLTEKYKSSISDTVNKLKDIQYVPAKNSIISNAPYYKVIMINESPAKPVHRAFTYSLLEDLYKEGYRYLAMEAFNNLANKCLDSVNVFTGYYICEPIAAELTRKALQIGYTLISYEDTLALKHTGSQRDSIQAENIYSVIKKDSSAKILVHAGYGHISEEKIGDYTPMASWFKKISGIDPFTIDQTGMTEGGEFEYGRIFYQYFNSRYKISEPSVVFQNKRPFNPLFEKGYDLLVMHPPTVYQHNRPNWISLNGDRKPALIQPTEKLLFFVQAYNENEYNAENINLLVPADQTYIANREGYYCLYLKKGKYKIILRDISYKILSTKDFDVE
ncbi:MAG: hypothetical protein WBC06_03830 [Chitinophagaceae bacterium]